MNARDPLVGGASERAERAASLTECEAVFAHASSRTLSTANGFLTAACLNSAYGMFGRCRLQ